MADDTDTGEKGGGFPGVVGGAAGAVVGGTAVAPAIARKPSDYDVQHGKAKEAITTAQKNHDDALNALTGDDAAKYTAYKDTKGAHEAKELEHRGTLNEHWNAAVKGEEGAIVKLTPAEAQKVRVANLKAQEELLAKDGSPAAKYARGGVEAQRKAIEGLKDADLTHANIESKLGSEWTKYTTDTKLPDGVTTDAVGSAMKGLGEKQEVLAAMEKAAPAEAKTAIGKATEGIKKEVGEKLEAFTKAKTPFETMEKGMKTKAPLDEAAKGLEKLGNVAKINEAGFMARPRKIMKYGTGGQKAALGIAAAVVAIGSYMGIKAYRNRQAANDAQADQPQQTSFTAAEDQRRAAATDQSAGRSA